MSKRTPSVETTLIEVNRLKGTRKGASLKEQVWFENGNVVAYSLAYINLKRCRVDHGRVLGYDNSHGFHHRHSTGKIERIVFTSYKALAERFIEEVHELGRIEDAEDDG
ncbi:MAG: hypothetical protein WAM85_06110 [Terracidiphilus sp.]